MTTTFIATSQTEHFTEFHFSQSFTAANGFELGFVCQSSRAV